MPLVASVEPSKRLTLKILVIVAILVAVAVTKPQTDERSLYGSANEKRSEDSSLGDKLDSLTNYVGILPQARAPLIYSKQYLLLDATTSEIIVSEGADTPIPIASTTKMTTALVASSLLSLDKVVTISSKPPTIQGSKIGLRPGEKITVRDLIFGLLIYSGNDAAFALAEAFSGIPGDYLQFVQQMNKFAHVNHLLKTNYGDPAGLDDETGRSTPRELANVARLLLQDPILSKIVSTPETTVSSIDGQFTHTLKNTNRLILPDNPYYLPNALGVKTGFTLDAGHSLVAAYRWHDRILIGVVMNTTESTITASATEMNKLFRWADRFLVLKQY
ncbi:MAG: serine hydrolase [Patescibacteria group bacterium]